MLLQELQMPDDRRPQEYKIFVDLDGVLVDFVEGVHRLVPDYSEEKYESDPKYRNKMWKAVHQFQKQQGEGFWSTCPPMKDYKQLWGHIQPLGAEVLSATGLPHYNAGPQKHEWVAKYLGPDVKVNLVEKARDKAQHAQPNFILIDDKQKAIGPWEAAGGIGILHTSAATTIAELKKLGL